MRITEITRRDISELLGKNTYSWYGRLDEIEFLGRLYNLESLPSTDDRHDTATGDIRQHRIWNWDWHDDWVFSDDRFELESGDDKIYLRFLAETLHPAVRPDTPEAERLCELYNQSLIHDGYQLVENSRLSGKPVYVGRDVGVGQAPGVNAAMTAFSHADLGYVRHQITKMDKAANEDVELALGTAKELIETCCKTILEDRGVEFKPTDKLQTLVRQTAQELQLTPDDIPDGAKAADTIKRLLSNLTQLAQGIVELRDLYGTGHGKSAYTKGLQPRHAKPATGAAATLAVFLIETHEDRSRSETNGNAR